MREEGVNKIEVHVAGVCFKGDSVLVGKRSSVKAFYPGLWECGGGQVNPGENLEEAVARKLKQEFGVIAKPVKVICTYEIPAEPSDQKKIPGVRFLCEIKGFVNGKEPVTGKDFDEWRWQPVDKIDELTFVPGLKEEIKQAFSDMDKTEKR